jgi:hypothetical protein
MAIRISDAHDRMIYERLGTLHSAARIDTYLVAANLLSRLSRPRATSSRRQHRIPRLP